MNTEKPHKTSPADTMLHIENLSAMVS